MISHLFIILWQSINVATLALGSWPRQGLAKTWAKEAQESHFMPPRVQKSVREWTFTHSQVSSHFGSWSPDGLLNLQGAIEGVKTHWIEKFFI